MIDVSSRCFAFMMYDTALKTVEYFESIFSDSEAKIQILKSVFEFHIKHAKSYKQVSANKKTSSSHRLKFSSFIYCRV